MSKGKALGVAFSEPTLDEITMKDGGNIATGTTTGSKIGTAASQKIGFLGATPIIQKSGASYTSGNTSALIASLISLAVSNSNILKSFGFAS